ncbi:MAG: hypothetical protein ABL995_13785 [Bryobacteraceae bacterium]
MSPRGFAGGPSYSGRTYVAPRSYGPPVRRQYYGGGLYLGYGAPYPYGYAYDSGAFYGSGYAYDPGYSYAPAPVPQACAQGYYDSYGTWIADPNCYSDQQQYPQYQQPQQNYYPNQGQYPPTQQYYDANPALPYGR